MARQLGCCKRTRTSSSRRVVRPNFTPTCAAATRTRELFAFPRALTVLPRSVPVCGKTGSTSRSQDRPRDLQGVPVAGDHRLHRRERTRPCCAHGAAGRATCSTNACDSQTHAKRMRGLWRCDGRDSWPRVRRGQCGGPGRRSAWWTCGAGCRARDETRRASPSRAAVRCVRGVVSCRTSRAHVASTSRVWRGSVVACVSSSVCPLRRVGERGPARLHLPLGRSTKSALLDLGCIGVHRNSCRRPKQAHATHVSTS